jgi:hypothetical protein
MYMLVRKVGQAMKNRLPKMVNNRSIEAVFSLLYRLKAPRSDRRIGPTGADLGMYRVVASSSGGACWRGNRVRPYSPDSPVSGYCDLCSDLDGVVPLVGFPTLTLP